MSDELKAPCLHSSLITHRSSLPAHSTRRGCCLTAPRPFVTITPTRSRTPKLVCKPFTRRLFSMSSKPPKDQQYVGVELCAGSARAALVSAAGEVLARRESASLADDAAGQVARLVADLRDEAGARVAAVGVGLPGLVSPETG